MFYGEVPARTTLGGDTCCTSDLLKYPTDMLLLVPPSGSIKETRVRLLGFPPFFSSHLHHLCSLLFPPAGPRVTSLLALLFLPHRPRWITSPEVLIIGHEKTDHWLLGRYSNWVRSPWFNRWSTLLSLYEIRLTLPPRPAWSVLSPSSRCVLGPSNYKTYGVGMGSHLGSLAIGIRADTRKSCRAWAP